MLNPFQCILFCSRPHPRLPLIVLAASGSSIYSFNASNGALLSVWPERAPIGVGASAGSPGSSDIISEPPGKRRKLSAGGSSESSSAEIVVENGKKSKKLARGKFMGGGIPAVIKLIGSSHGRQAVAVTGEDKCIRVFDILDDGSIEQISERAMPKRPCSIALNTNEESILCGDKFGDVYALPLRDVPIDPNSSPSVIEASEARAAPIEKKFVPAANNLTIHTKTNQRALLNQQRAANKTAERKALAFTHQLLLGHVSLLTDLVYVTLTDFIESGPRNKDYIITADRDEHIRVSRGPPQSHVIESYCLGHRCFVSKLCIPKWEKSILISGGGDGFLLLWNWSAGLARQKVEIATLLDTHRPPSTTVPTASKKRAASPTSHNDIAVSGLWAVETQSEDLVSSWGDIFVACEGVPALLVLSVTPESRLEYRDCLYFQGNVLDLTHDLKTGVLLVSLDNAHLPWSTDKLREEKSNVLLAHCRYSTEHRRWTVGDEQFGLVTAINVWANEAEALAITQPPQEQALSDILYGIENLRKKGDEA